ncbi:mCG1028709, partial [Mus musculus]
QGSKKVESTHKELALQCGNMDSPQWMSEHSSGDPLTPASLDKDYRHESPYLVEIETLNDFKLICQKTDCEILAENWLHSKLVGSILSWSLLQILPLGPCLDFL